ncbi:MAG: hybrid sensor histidine kinase/response regulator [Candidatus Omnitrophota bacterium]
MMKEINVVILDDEQNILNSLTRLFKDEPFGIFTTTKHSEALEAISKEKVKVVLSDHRMPEISGTEFLEKVKEKYPYIVRILFTGYTDIQIAEDAINKGGVYRFINKPWDDISLRRTILEAIERFDLRQKNRELMEEITNQNNQLLALNAKLGKMYEAQKEFSSTVSHELRTPLASIKTTIDVVMSETPGQLNDDQKNFLNKAKSNVDRLSRLVNDVLSLSKLESGKEILNLTETDVNIIITEVADIQRFVADKKGLYIKTHLSGDIPMVLLDSDKINQVLDNLIGNAIKFTEKGGIDISTGVIAKEESVVIKIKDSGPGIRQEDIDKLFKKFQQLGDYATRGTGGTGLGLAICKEIIEKHCGKIWVESGQSGGSSFCFTLPAKKREENG